MGEKIVVDVAMEQLKLAIEVQLVAHHTDPVSFCADQLRIARLVANGWTYFPVTVPMMEDEATLMALLQATVVRCQLEQGLVPDAERCRPGGLLSGRI